MYRTLNPFECQTSEEQYHADRAQMRQDRLRAAWLEAIESFVDIIAKQTETPRHLLAGPPLLRPPF